MSIGVDVELFKRIKEKGYHKTEAKCCATCEHHHVREALAGYNYQIGCEEGKKYVEVDPLGLCDVWAPRQWWC